MKNNRLKIYFLVSFFTNALISIVKLLLDENLWLVIKEMIITFPVIFGYLWLIYYLRKKLILLNVFPSISGKHYLQRWLIFGGIIIVKAFVLTIPLRMVILFFFADDNEDALFDLSFAALYAGTFLTIFFVYPLESSMEEQIEKQRMKEELAKYEYEKSLAKYLSLKKQLNPHFLFNSFNSLAGLISVAPGKAERFVEELSNVYRYTLDKSDEIVVPLQEELHLALSYMNLQKYRHGNAIQLKQEVDACYLTWLLPPMTLELILENAIKHNTFDRKKPLKIKMITRDQNIIITNTYSPKSKPIEKESVGIGLKNLISQYSFIYDHIPEFTINKSLYIAKIPLLPPES
ncbi:sensor histidine kinase [Ascidiimonas aurantiaca]|uniref:sensor histidine kinase n=1 Tax=Ascidiimonas aurantiaca TaxID=1685432 RepID=UPI0030EE620B